MSSPRSVFSERQPAATTSPSPAAGSQSAWRIRLLAAVALAAWCATASAEQPSEAWWIGPASSQVNQWTRFHRSFELGEVPAKATAFIAADTKYWLWVNGRLAVLEGGLKRGPAPGSIYRDEVDLAPWLKQGKNSLAVLVWHFGQDGFSHDCSGSPGLHFSMDLPGGRLVSDATWRMSAHPAIATSKDTAPNRRLPESSLSFDARRDEPAWTEDGFDASAWPAPVAGGGAGSPPWGPFVPRPIPQWKDYGLKDYAEVREENGLVKGRLPYNAQVHPWMEIEAPAGLVIDIRTDNFMGGSEPNVHAKYITREGVQSFECVGWMNGHEVHYRMPAGVKVRSLKFRETGYDTAFTGSFRCDDADLNTLWTKAARTLYVTMRDSYMDCPDRERAQWWGDVVNELGEVPYALDPRANLLTRKAIRELVDWRRADGTLYSPVPAGIPADGSRKDDGRRQWNTELPVQMLASIGKYGFWTYYLNTGDADSAWFQLALEGAVEMARLACQESDIPRWEALQQRIASGFNKTFWTGTEYRSPGYRGDTDDRANALAVLAGFAAPAQYPALCEVFAKHRNASPWMEKYVIEALYRMDRPDLAVARMKERYRAQIDSPLTTLWEGWGLGGEGFGGGSYNHAWSGGPLTCLSRFAAGISPTSPGYKSFEIKPQMGPLKSLEAEVDSPHGLIRLMLERGDASFAASGRVPDGTRGRIGVPRQGTGQKFIVNGAPTAAAHSTESFHFFDLGPGEFSIRGGE